MWTLNEADIIDETVESALKNVDTLMVLDDGSTDGTWERLEKFKSRLEYLVKKPNGKPKMWGQNHLLSVVRKRFKPSDTWVQIIESDIMICDTNIRDAISRFSVNDMAVHWQLLNAVRSDWADGDDEYPNWSKPISEVLPRFHWYEKMLYTFRPVSELVYVETKPWPKGFSGYKVADIHRKHDESPLLAHYGYRGPKHFCKKYARRGKFHPKYKSWRIDDPVEVMKTVPFFNGRWNGESVTGELTRKGWQRWLRKMGGDDESL